jgi:hypothetical protein
MKKNIEYLSVRCTEKEYPFLKEMLKLIRKSKKKEKKKKEN